MCVSAEEWVGALSECVLQWLHQLQRVLQIDHIGDFTLSCLHTFLQTSQLTAFCALCVLKLVFHTAIEHLFGYLHAERQQVIDVEEARENGLHTEEEILVRYQLLDSIQAHLNRL